MNFFRTWNSRSGGIHDDEARYVQERLDGLQDEWEAFTNQLSTSIGYGENAHWLSSLPMMGSAAAGGGLRGALFTAGAETALFSQSLQSSHSKRQLLTGQLFPFDPRARSIGLAGASGIGAHVAFH